MEAPSTVEEWADTSAAHAAEAHDMLNVDPNGPDAGPAARLATAHALTSIACGLAAVFADTEGVLR